MDSDRFNINENRKHKEKHKMIDKKGIEAIAFDFGGTLDSPFKHWFTIYLEAYSKVLDTTVEKEQLLDAYIKTEQMLEREGLIASDFDLYQTQLTKTNLQVEFLVEEDILPISSPQECAEEVANYVTYYATKWAQKSKPVLEYLKSKYRLFVVSNYYGNLESVLEGLSLTSYFSSLTDSTVANLRKPDPALWQLAIDQEELQPENVLVVGDSLKNDILPALSIGCQAIHGVENIQTENTDGVIEITHLKQLLEIL